jgi:hypothetical protein
VTTLSFSHPNESNAIAKIIAMNFARSALFISLTIQMGVVVTDTVKALDVLLLIIGMSFGNFPAGRRLAAAHG